MELLFLLGGIVLGSLLTLYTTRRKIVGTLKVDYSDPDSGAYLFLEIPQKNSHMIMELKEVTFKVDIR